MCVCVCVCVCARVRVLTLTLRQIESVKKKLSQVFRVDERHSAPGGHESLLTSGINVGGFFSLIWYLAQTGVL